MCNNGHTQGLLSGETIGARGGLLSGETIGAREGLARLLYNCKSICPAIVGEIHLPCLS